MKHVFCSFWIKCDNLSCYHFSFWNCVTIYSKESMKRAKLYNWNNECIRGNACARASKQTTNVLLFDPFETRSMTCIWLWCWCRRWRWQCVSSYFLSESGSKTIQSSTRCFVTWNVAPDFADCIGISAEFQSGLWKCWVAVSQMPSLKRVFC